MSAVFLGLTASSAMAALGDVALREGSTGPDVVELQKALTKAGFEVDVDGTFGPTTLQAVKRFQGAAQLETSGAVGPKTVATLKRALRGTAANVSGGFDPERADEERDSLGDRIPLRRGMSGRDVRVLQDYLRTAGVRRLKVDGAFGRATALAVRRFERRAKRRVNGVVDAADINALRVMAGEDDPGVLTTAVALAPGQQATIGPDGLAIAPAEAPEEVKAIIAAANRIAKKPYRYGGGHAKIEDSGYDCSGSVSYALIGAGLLTAPGASGDFFGYGDRGAGQWVTIYTKSSHMYMVVAGLRFDTSGRSSAGTRWQAEMRSAAGYRVRHPPGL